MTSVKILKVLEILQARGLLQAPGQLDLLAEEIEKELSLSTKAMSKNLGKFKGFTTGER
jgi:hypothetical protein